LSIACDFNRSPLVEGDPPPHHFQPMAARQGLDQPGAAAEPRDLDVQLDVDGVGIMPALFFEALFHAGDDASQAVEVFSAGAARGQPRNFGLEGPASNR